MKKFNICTTNSVCIEGMRLPKGAMYGTDSKGLWVCLNYQVHNIFDLPKSALSSACQTVGINVKALEEVAPITRRLLISLLKKERSIYKRPIYRNVWNERGEVGRVLIRPAEARPFLTLLRPVKRDLATGSGYENRTKWVRSLEFGETVDKILALVEKYPERTEIVRSENHSFKSVAVIVNGEMSFTRVPTVSNTQAAAVAGNPDGRGIKEFMPHAVMHGLSRPRMTEYSFPTGNYVDLEKLAAEQRAAMPKPTKPQNKPTILVNIYPETTIRR